MNERLLGVGLLQNCAIVADRSDGRPAHSTIVHASRVDARRSSKVG